jgi:hypothetical protein
MPDTSTLPDPGHTFVYWMFNLQKTFSACFPGPLSILPLAAVEKMDRKIRDFQAQIPPNMTVPDGYIPGPTESALDIIRRYIIAATMQGYINIVHRLHMTKSELCGKAALESAWILASYQSQLVAHSNLLEPFAWFIEEFLDVHMLRAAGVLAVLLVRNPNSPYAVKAMNFVDTSISGIKKKSLRKKVLASVYGPFRALQALLSEKLGIPIDSGEDSSGIQISTAAPDVSVGLGWGMDETLMGPLPKWDEYFVDVVNSGIC